MKTTQLGRTSESIPVVGFGGMPLSIDGRPDEATGKRVINAAIDAGMTLLDTADVYCIDDDDIGHNERLIASALRERKNAANVRVATKAGLRRPKGAWNTDGSPQHIREACEQSLRSLGTGTIWLYQFHAPDSKVPFEKSVETFAELKREGKCLHVGLSNVSVEQIEAAQRIVEIVSVQNRLNPYFRESVGVARWCAENGVTFLAYSPVGGGRLAKRLPQFTLLQKIAKRHECSVHAVVLAWVRAQSSAVVPIPAARSVEHAVDSAHSADVTLAADEIAAIDAAEFDRS